MFKRNGGSLRPKTNSVNQTSRKFKYRPVQIRSSRGFLLGGKGNIGIEAEGLFERGRIGKEERHGDKTPSQGAPRNINTRGGLSSRRAR